MKRRREREESGERKMKRGEEQEGVGKLGIW